MELTNSQPIGYDNEPQFGKIGLNMLPEDSEETAETKKVDSEKQPEQADLVESLRVMYIEELKKELRDKGNTGIVEIIENVRRDEKLKHVDTALLLTAAKNDGKSEMHELAYGLIMNPEKVKLLKEVQFLIDDIEVGPDGTVHCQQSGRVIPREVVAASLRGRPQGLQDARPDYSEYRSIAESSEWKATCAQWDEDHMRVLNAGYKEEEDRVLKV